MADMITEIKKLISEGVLVIGGDRVLKGLKKSQFSRIYLAANCPAQLKGDVERYASMGGAEVVDTGIQNVELGDICKKPFPIAAMGLPK